METEVMVLAKVGGARVGGFRSTPKFSTPKVSKPVTVKPLPQGSLGKPIVKNDTKASVPKAEIPKASKPITENNIVRSNAVGTPNTVYANSGGFSFRDYLFYRWLFNDNNHRNSEVRTEQGSGGSFDTENENSASKVFGSLTLFLMVTILVVAVFVWWINRKN